MLILAYHRVNPEIRDGLSVSPQMLQRQLAHLLANGWHNVLLDEVIATSTESSRDRSFAITFDDGYQDNYFHAVPVLEGLGLRATVFLIAGQIDSPRPFPWLRITPSDSYDPEDLHMTTNQIRELLDRGTIAFGSHTMTHPLLSELDREVARGEIESSKHVLEDRFGIGVKTFCYPAGNFNAETVELVQQAGYLAAVVTPNRFIEETDYAMHRIGVYSNMTPTLFRVKTHPAFARLQKTRPFWAMRHRFDPRHRRRTVGAVE